MVSSPFQVGDPGARDEDLEGEGEGLRVVDVAGTRIRDRQSRGWVDTHTQTDTPNTLQVKA